MTLIRDHKFLAIFACLLLFITLSVLFTHNVTAGFLGDLIKGIWNLLTGLLDALGLIQVTIGMITTDIEEQEEELEREEIKLHGQLSVRNSIERDYQQKRSEREQAIKKRDSEWQKNLDAKAQAEAKSAEKDRLQDQLNDTDDPAERERLQNEINVLEGEIRDANNRARGHRRASWGARLTANRLLGEMHPLGLESSRVTRLITGTERRIRVIKRKIAKLKDDLDKAKKEHAEKQREIDRLRQEYDDLQNNPPGNGGLVPVPPDDDDDDDDDDDVGGVQEDECDYCDNGGCSACD